MRAAKKADWKTLRMPKLRATIPLSRCFSSADLHCMVEASVNNDPV